MQARFFFTSPEFTVEFEGAEEFVAEQIERVRARVRAIVLGTDMIVDPPQTPDVIETPGATTLEAVFAKANIREGRGALQDSILVFANYLLKNQGKHEFTIEDLNFCFDLLEHRRPKSLANTLGILKRDRRLLHAGSQRGSYTLSDKGNELVRRLL